MGLPQDPWRAGRPGRKDSGVDGMGDPEERRNRPRAAADRANLVPAPALTSRSGPGVRFLHSRPARRHPGLCPGGDRTRDPAHPHPRNHAASDREMDHPAGTQPPHGPRRANAPGQVHDPRPRLELHRSVRRGPRRCRCPDVLCNVRTPRMNAITERWIGGCRRELLDRALVWNQPHLRRILRDYETHHNQHRPHRSLNGAAPLKPLPEPVDLGQCRVRRQTRVCGLINEYRLVA
jgi:hypothetical protein